MKTLQPIEPLIVRIRGERVILDADLARLYGVTTKRFNEAFKRNRQRFPEDFAFRLTPAEFANLKSQFVISRSQDVDSKGKKDNWSQIATSSGRHRATVYSPWAFTEHGALMAANILRSAQAVQMSVFVIRAFVRMREQVAANTAILKRLAQIDKTLLEHDAALAAMYRKLLPLLQPEPAPKNGVLAFCRMTVNDRAQGLSGAGARFAARVFYPVRA